MNAIKQSRSYLDTSINSNAGEKCMGMTSYLGGAGTEPVSILEVGPGGGAALDGLADYTAQHQHGPITIHVLERFASNSWALHQARARLESQGIHTTQTIADLTQTPYQNESQNVVNASALMHEVYSYAGAYKGLDQALGEITRVLKPGGQLVYRDIYSVDGDLHKLVPQVYEKPSWQQFANLFLPYYLNHAAHPYDEGTVSLNKQGSVMAGEMPAGLARDLQRHYLMFRDDLWRSGLLGFRPTTSTYRETQWLDQEKTNKKVYYEFTGSHQVSRLPVLPHAIFAGEDEGGQFAEGTVFDETTDDVISHVLENIACNAQLFAQIEAWLQREGPEVYVYDTPESFIERVSEVSMEVSNDEHALETTPEQTRKILRDYYTSYLKRALGDYALEDAKLMVQFTKKEL